MLRPFAYTLVFVASFGAFTYVAAQHLVVAEARVASAERNIADLRREVEELRERVDAPPPPPPPPTRPGQADASKVYAVPTGDRPSRGPADAWVTIIEFADYQCPFCSRVESTLAQVRERYGDDVRIVFRHQPLPFHAKARDAAIAVECAGEQGLFWQMHDVVFARQRELSHLDVNTLGDGVNGLEYSRFLTCTEGENAKRRVAEDQSVAQRFGANGTPTFFVNGKIVTGAQPMASFESRIDEALATAKASGIPKGDYYRRAVLEQGAQGL